MKKLLTVVVMLCMVLGMGSMAFAQTGNVSADLWFLNHTLELPEVEKAEATGMFTGVKGEFDITKKIGVTGSAVFGKTDDFKDNEGMKAELTNFNVAVQYQVIPMVKAQAGFFSGGYSVGDGDEFKISGITIGATVDFEVGNGISLFGEANYAPLATAKIKDNDDFKFDDSSMMAFEAGGKYDFGQFQAKAGYRYQGFEFKEKDANDKEKLNATFSGFFVGGGVRF